MDGLTSDSHNPITQKEIYNKYPKIFIQHTYMANEQNMYVLGLCVNDGWLPVIDRLCEKIQTNVDKRGIKQIEAEQVKEKYASLCFYVNYHDKEINGMIREAQHEASAICEKCGKGGHVREDDGWLQVLCDDCNEPQSRL